MAHKPSTDSRMAGGKEWRSVKSGDRRIRFTQKNPPQHIVDYGNRMAIKNDEAVVARDNYVQGQRDYAAGKERMSDCPQYNAGYSYAEYVSK